MKIRRRTKSIIAALLALVLCLSGFLPSAGMQTVRAEENETKVWFEYSDGTVQEPDEKNAIILRPTDVGTFKTNASQDDLTWNCTDKYFRAEVGDLDYTTHYWINTKSGAFQPCEDVPTRGGVEAELKDGDGNVLCSFIVRIVDDGAVITSVLRTLINHAEQKAETAYTGESWKTMQEALTEAKAIYEDASAKQDVVDAAFEKLNAAVQGLVKAESEKDIFASDKGGTVYASVEKFTIGQGYLIEPTEVAFEAGETYADIIEKLLKENGYTYDVTNTGMGFYLAEIDHADSGVLNIPKCISNMSENAPTNENHRFNPYEDTQGLGELSYSKYSGWYYFVNNKNPGVGMGSTKAKDGDVVRYQFTLYGLGADLGDKANDQTGGIKALELPNKDSVTKNLALMRQILAKDAKADEMGVYQAALKIIADMDSTQEQFAQAEQSVSTWLAEYPQKKEERDQAEKEKAEKEKAEKEKAEREKAAKEAALQKKYTPAKTILRSIKNAGKNKVRLTWKKISKATGYEIYRSTKKNGTYKKIKTINKNKTVSFVTKLPKKKGTYYFKVRTYRKAEGKVYYGKDSAVKSKKVK